MSKMRRINKNSLGRAAALACISVAVLFYNNCSMPVGRSGGRGGAGSDTQKGGVIVGNPDQPTAMMPKVYLDSQFPMLTPGHAVLTVGANGRKFRSCQDAIDAAQPGDEVVIDAGYVCAPVTLGPKNGASALVIRTSDLSALSAEGTRISRQQAAHLAIIETSGDLPAVTFSDGAHNYHLVGLEIRVSAASKAVNYGIIEIGRGLVTSWQQIPHDITLARSWIHGGPNSEVKRGVQLDGLAVSIVDSIIEDIHRHGQFTQAIQGRNAGFGPYKIINNEIISAGYAFELGGAATAVPDMVPSDVEFRQNYVHKLVAWQAPVTGNTGETGLWVTEGHIRLDNAQRILIDGNLFENSWLSEIAGFEASGTAFFLGPVGDWGADGLQPWARVQDITFRNNIVRHAPAVFDIRYQDPNLSAAVLQRVDVRNCLFYDIGTGWGAAGAVVKLAGQAQGPVSFVSNTVIDSPAAGVSLILAEDTAGKGLFTFINNVVVIQQKIFSSVSGLSPDSAVIGSFFTDLKFFANVFAFQVPASFGGLADRNFFVANDLGVGFVTPPSQNPANDRGFQLSPASPFLLKGYGGSNPGADFNQLPAF